jgi:hypothetical protein
MLQKKNLVTLFFIDDLNKFILINNEIIHFTVLISIKAITPM